MHYTAYQKSRNLSWEILINEGVTALPVKMGELCAALGIRVITHSGEIESYGDGKAGIVDGKPIIFVNTETSSERQRFTVAHEVGHILLGHVGEYKLVNREPSPEDNPIEQAANVFTSRLLAPACVLWGLDIHTAEGIAALCKISKAAAQFRAQRMAELYEREKRFLKEKGRSCFLISPLEQQVFRQFKQFIAERRN